ncbi:hypothetical protein APHAL10511_007208 [Amanita phalloides]|nr:hypothetical protein APHAL10511_007208 [Amanita phalloides]
MLQGDCTTHHDWFNALLTFGLCCGLIVSYAPQHYRIISSGTSLGLSPWFLLLGSTSATAGFLNMITLQWHIVKCCPTLPLGSCLEMSAGIFQIGLQWLLFTIILVLYMIYYPQELKYEAYGPSNSVQKVLKKRDHWWTSIVLAWIVAALFAITLIITIYLLATSPLSPSPDEPLPDRISSWATFLGVSSALLAAVQYAPQLKYTFDIKLVGALSIPMMLIQTPGAILMILSIALRPGTNWTSWITYAVAGIMQGSLLVMCLVWKVRQKRLGVNDFGQCIGGEEVTEAPVDEVTPLLRPDGA